MTGASGFIGSALCYRLAGEGSEVWGLGRRPRPARFSGRWVTCDVADPEQAARAVRECRPEIVFHLASSVSGARKLELVLPMLQANTAGFLNVALAAAESHCARIVGMGSLQEPDQALPAIPSSPYAAAKFAASCYARMLVSTFNVPIVLARPLMVYGPDQHDYTKVVPHLLTQMLAGNEASLSSGKHPFDWVYIDDVCNALLAIATSDGVLGKTIDVGTGVLTSVVDVARGIADRLDTVNLLRIGAIPDRTGEPVRTADVAATEAMTGWRARVGLDEGLDRTVSWFRENHASMISANG